MLNQTRAYLLGLAAVLLWSTVASAFKISLRYLDPLQLLLYATAASTLLLAGILTCRGRLGAILSCTRRDFATSILLGFLNPVFANVGQSTLHSFTDAGRINSFGHSDESNVVGISPRT